MDNANIQFPWKKRTSTKQTQITCGYTQVQLMEVRFCFVLFCFLYNTVFLLISSVHFSRSVMSHSLQPHGLQHTRLPVHHQLPELIHSCPSSRWCHSTISSSVPPSPPAFSLSLMILFTVLKSRGRGLPTSQKLKKIYLGYCPVRAVRTADSTHESAIQTFVSAPVPMNTFSWLAHQEQKWSFYLKKWVKLREAPKG